MAMLNDLETQYVQKSSRLTLHKYFMSWRDELHHKIAFKRYINEGYKRTPSTFPDMFKYESRVAKVDSPNVRDQDSENLLAQTRNPQVFQSDTLGSYHVKNLNDQYSANIFEANPNMNISKGIRKLDLPLIKFI